MPLVKEVEAHVRAGKIGEITRIYADLAMDFKIKGLSLDSRFKVSRSLTSDSVTRF